MPFPRVKLRNSLFRNSITSSSAATSSSNSRPGPSLPADVGQINLYLADLQARVCVVLESLPELRKGPVLHEKAAPYRSKRP